MLEQFRKTNLSELEEFIEDDSINSDEDLIAKKK